METNIRYEDFEKTYNMVAMTIAIITALVFLFILVLLSIKLFHWVFF